ncbi:MAG: cobalamin-dependent protein [Spirochaetes bacterium]|nr:cobalamin-dependent protein [Spirochaetota bacterium]
MSLTEYQDKLVSLITDLEEENTIKLLQQLIDKDENPLEIIDVCHKGMSEVGRLYEEGSYFISGLIMAGDIMRQVNQMLFPLIENSSGQEQTGSIVLGTVEGDIHYIGKDIFKQLVSVYGFTVNDLGVDVPAEKFLEVTLKIKPKIVGLSCLVSAAIVPMEKTISLLKENLPENIQPKYIIGGQVDELVCKQVGADYWVNNAMAGVRICQKIMEEKNN